jgi:hypothetical protein
MLGGGRGTVPMLFKYTGTLLCLAISIAPRLAGQQQTEGVTPRYADAPRPKCDSYTMQNRVRLTALEKTCYYRDQLFAPSAVFGAAFFGGIAQAMNSPTQWPQGAKGYEWRASTRYVQGMAKSTGGYLAGLALHEDPRSLRPDCTRGHDLNYIVTEAAAPKSFWHRVGGAVAVNFWTRNDNCKYQPAFSASAGALSSGFVGMAWTPNPSNTVSKAFVRSGTALGGAIGSSVFTEFKGDITNLFSKMLSHKAGSGGGSQQ